MLLLFELSLSTDSAHAIRFIIARMVEIKGCQLWKKSIFPTFHYFVWSAWSHSISIYGWRVNPAPSRSKSRVIVSWSCLIYFAMIAIMIFLCVEYEMHSSMMWCESSILSMQLLQYGELESLNLYSDEFSLLYLIHNLVTTVSTFLIVYLAHVHASLISLIVPKCVLCRDNSLI